jgi:hypothetical protein
MTAAPHARDYLLPRVAALIDDAVAQGIARDVAVAVLIDLITSTTFDTAAPDPAEDLPPHLPSELDPDSAG